MKDKIHPKYQPAVITCACGAKLKTRSTKPEISTEVCSDCHPFFTGKQKLLDTAGRVDKFKAKLEAAKKMSASKKKPATKKSAPKTAAKKSKK